MYFRALSLFGLVCAFFVGYGMMGNSLFSLATKGGAAFPILVGALTCFFSGFSLDKKIKLPWSWKSKIFFSPVIFMSGVLIGSFLNFFLNGRVLSSPFGMWEEFFDWFVKPVFWLSWVGLPASLIIGGLSFAVETLMKSKQKRTGY